MTAERLLAMSVFQYFKEVVPLEAKQLITALRSYERDQDLYKDANQRGLQFRLDNRTLQARQAAPT